MVEASPYAGKKHAAEHTHTHTHACTLARLHARTDARTHAGTQARRHAGTQAHRHTHTHTANTINYTLTAAMHLSWLVVVSRHPMQEGCKLCYLWRTNMHDFSHGIPQLLEDLDAHTQIPSFPVTAPQLRAHPRPSSARPGPPSKLRVHGSGGSSLKRERVLLADHVRLHHLAEASAVERRKTGLAESRQPLGTVLAPLTRE